MYETILYTEENGEAVITLNRPEKLNSINFTMIDELLDAINKVKEEGKVRCLVLTGTGRAFCTGADLKSGLIDNPSEVTKMLREKLSLIIRGLREMNKPVIAAVNGVAAGAGCGLALACDLILARESSYFFLAFAGIGMVPDAGLSYYLPRLAGPKKAMELALLGKKTSAAEACRLGLINRAVPDAEFDAEVKKLSARLTAGPFSQGLIKVMFNGSPDKDLDQCLETEAVYQGMATASKDAAEGVAAFLEKRKARFTGE